MIEPSSGIDAMKFKYAIIMLSLSFGTPVEAGPMEFAEHFNGAMRIDGHSAWISAEGEITAETPAAFEKFLEHASIWKNQRIAISSRGGSVLAGMKTNSHPPRSATIRKCSTTAP